MLFGCGTLLSGGSSENSPERELKYSEHIGIAHCRGTVGAEMKLYSFAVYDLFEMYGCILRLTVLTKHNITSFS